MMTHPKRRISADRINEKLRQNEKETEQGIVNIYISYLKKKLEFLNADIKIAEVNNSVYGLEPSK
ncbi:MAG: helix-turn-helix domain-containing protein, partial [Clostridiales bacterium]|nr:helix-turn-helix domain-containing protein [Clostridiales bacterium]